MKLGALKRTDHPSKYQLVDSEKAFMHENIVWSRWVKGLVEKNDIGLIRMKESFDSMYIKSWQKNSGLKCIYSKKCFVTLSVP